MCIILKHAITNNFNNEKENFLVLHCCTSFSSQRKIKKSNGLFNFRSMTFFSLGAIWNASLFYYSFCEFYVSVSFFSSLIYYTICSFFKRPWTLFQIYKVNEEEKKWKDSQHTHFIWYFWILMKYEGFLFRDKFAQYLAFKAHRI